MQRRISGIVSLSRPSPCRSIQLHVHVFFNSGHRRLSVFFHVSRRGLESGQGQERMRRWRRGRRFPKGWDPHHHAHVVRLFGRLQPSAMNACVPRPYLRLLLSLFLSSSVLRFRSLLDGRSKLADASCVGTSFSRWKVSTVHHTFHSTHRLGVATSNCVDAPSSRTKRTRIRREHAREGRRAR